MWFWFFILLIVAPAAAASDIPVGERVYTTDAKDPFSPVKVVDRNQAPNGLLDPNQRATDRKPAPPAVKTVVVKTNKVKEKRLSFRPVLVKGRIANPRVDFTREALQLGRVDEENRIEFYRRIFETAPGEL